MKYWVYDDIGLLRKFYTKQEATSFAKLFGYEAVYVRPPKLIFEEALF